MLDHIPNGVRSVGCKALSSVVARQSGGGFQDRPAHRLRCAKALANLGGRHIAGSSCGIAIVTNHERLLIAALCANEYLDIQFKGRPLWADPF